MSALELFAKAGVPFPTPEAVIDLSTVVEVVREQRLEDPQAPGVGLPTRKGSHCPHATTLYEHRLEEDPRALRVLFVSQEAGEDGGYEVDVSILDVYPQADETVSITYYGRGVMSLSGEGCLETLTQLVDPNAEHVVRVEAGEFLEMAFPLLVANHLMHAGGVEADDFAAAGDYWPESNQPSLRA